MASKKFARETGGRRNKQNKLKKTKTKSQKKTVKKTKSRKTKPTKKTTKSKKMAGSIVETEAVVETEAKHKPCIYVVAKDSEPGHRDEATASIIKEKSLWVPDGPSVDESTVKLRKWTERDIAMVQVRIGVKTMVTFQVRHVGQHRSEQLLSFFRDMVIKGFTKKTITIVKQQILQSVAEQCCQ